MTIRFIEQKRFVLRTNLGLRGGFQLSWFPTLRKEREGWGTSAKFQKRDFQA
jgi:hypothetical protein